MTVLGGSMARDALRACGLFGHADERHARRARRRPPHPPVPQGRDGLPPGRPGRRAVHRRERLGQGRPAVRRGRRAGDRRGPRRRASSSASWRSSTARRTPRRSSRSSRPRRSSSTATRSSRLIDTRARAAPRPARVARDRDPAPDRPRRGPPLPRPARPPRVADPAASPPARAATRRRRDPASPWPYTQSELAGHDRRLAPVGEPAARRPRRRGPRPARARRPGRHRSGTGWRARSSGDRPPARPDEAAARQDVGRPSARSRRSARSRCGSRSPAASLPPAERRSSARSSRRRSPCSTPRRPRSPSTTRRPERLVFQVAAGTPGRGRRRPVDRAGPGHRRLRLLDRPAARAVGRRRRSPGSAGRRPSRPATCRARSSRCRSSTTRARSASSRSSTSATEAAFDLRDIELASVFARQAAVAIRASRLERDAAALARCGPRSRAIAAGRRRRRRRGRRRRGRRRSTASDDDGALWALADEIARLRAADPAELDLVRELLGVLVRRAERGDAGRRRRRRGSAATR